MKPKGKVDIVLYKDDSGCLWIAIEDGIRKRQIHPMMLFKNIDEFSGFIDALCVFRSQLVNQEVETLSESVKNDVAAALDGGFI